MSDKATLTYLAKALELFGVYDGAMHLPTILVFLTVANEPGIKKTELERRLGLSNSACSRHVMMLTKKGDFARLGHVGHDLVFSETDPLDSRNKRVRLTKRGDALRDHLALVLKRIKHDAN
ncbi:MAG: winged helix-turn-helix transcriptional regulator [Rhizobiales bacterium]|nr:winged helix-turn-helix transcriptional regulator [Hyphomicrobiales bacterium]